MTPAGQTAPGILAVDAEDGHRFELITRVPADATRSLLWLPALGVAARHYLPLAEALAARGVAVFLHEWRGHGSSRLRAARDRTWGYRELLDFDLAASESAVAAAVPGLPRIAGGHSLGGQLAGCRIGRSPETYAGLWLAGSGAPYWRAFPRRERLWLPLAYRFLPWLAERAGRLPGRRIGFGGNEARGVIRDWAGTAMGGHYRGAGVGDLEPGMAASGVEIRAALFEDDWFAPRGSLEHLLSKFPAARAREVRPFDADALGVPADHFAWMAAPAVVAEWFSR